MPEIPLESGIHAQSDFRTIGAADKAPQNAAGKSVERGHERRDVDLRPIILTALIMGAMAITIHVGLWYLMKFLYANPGETAERRAADARGPQVPPSPGLQVSPQLDLLELRRQESDAVNTYRWKDRNQGFAQIPVDRAIDILARSGLPQVQPARPDGTVVRGGAVSPAAVFPSKPEDIRQMERSNLIRSKGRP